MYTAGDYIHLSLDSSFVISGSTTDSKKISVIVSCTLPYSFFFSFLFFSFLFFFFDSLSSDNIAFLLLQLV